MKNMTGTKQYFEFIKKYVFKNKLIILYTVVISIIIFTAIISLIRPQLQGQVIDDLHMI